MEFAILSPILVLMMFGLAEAARVVRAKSQLTAAVATTADVIAMQGSVNTVPGKVNANTLQDFCKGATLMMQSTMQASFAMSILSVTNVNSKKDGSGTTTYVQDWEVDKACPTAGASFGLYGSSSALQALAGNYIPQQGMSVILVRASFPYVPAISNQPITAGAMTLTFTVPASPRAINLTCVVASGANCNPSGDLP